MKSFFKIFTVLTPKQLKICIGLIIMMFFIAIFEALGIGLIYPLIDIMGDSNYLVTNNNIITQFASFFGITTHKSLVLVSAAFLLAFYILKNVLILVQGKMQITFSLNNQADYTKRLYKYYMNKNYLYHVNTNIAEITRNILLSSIIAFSDLLINTLVIITNLITMFVILIFLVVMDWMMALVVVGVIVPLMFLIVNYFRKKINYFGNIQNECNAQNNKWINQGFYSVKETKVMQKETFFTEQFSNSFSKFSESQKQFLFMNRFPKSIIEMVSIGGIIGLVIFKTLIKADVASIIPSLGVLGLAAMRLMPCMNQVTGLYNQNKFKIPLFNEVYDDFMAIKKMKDNDEKKITRNNSEVIHFEKEISVENLSFKYPDNSKNVFTQVNFKIPKGKFVGIVGPSGAGKTTFVDLLLGLLNPSEGTIKVDDKNIFDNINAWLDNVSYVPQSIYLIDGSIRENVAFGVLPEDIDDDKVTKVLKMAELYDFVQTLDLKENTPCGDKGAKLSGGQKQRIGIARALYQNPSVLVLDEATSALDGETEKQITETINKLKGDITIIAIAHRLSTLESCDFKIKFENGTAIKVE